MDGVPFITQPPIKPGETFIYEFTARTAGSHMYHSHHNAAEQVTLGLLGAFIVEPKDPADEPAFDSDYLYILNDALGGFTINGKGFPATEPLIAKNGQRVRIRFMNEGLMIHPMHLHGMPTRSFAKDGYPLPQPFTVRHAQRRARASAGTSSSMRRQPGHLGLPLPHPHPRRSAAAACSAWSPSSSSNRNRHDHH